MKKQNMQAIYRQGDVLIQKIDSIPPGENKKRENGILAYGEVTGHAHRIEKLECAEVLECGSNLFLRVGEEGVRIIHDEHHPVGCICALHIMRDEEGAVIEKLPTGNYQVTIQREYTPEAIHNVAD